MAIKRKNYSHASEGSVLDGCLFWESWVVVPGPGKEALVEELHGGASGCSSHEILGEELCVVAGHLKGSREMSTQLPLVPAVKEHASASTTSPMGVAKGTLGLSPSRLYGTIPGSDISGAGRCIY